jgi:hypothetical protein
MKLKEALETNKIFQDRDGRSYHYIYPFLYEVDFKGNLKNGVDQSKILEWVLGDYEFEFNYFACATRLTLIEALQDMKLDDIIYNLNTDYAAGIYKSNNNLLYWVINDEPLTGEDIASILELPQNSWEIWKRKEYPYG